MTAQPQSTRAFGRRVFLRGAGAAIALPWLRSASAASGPEVAAPRRLAYLYVPNGVRLSHWKLAEPGPLGELTPSLAPLAPLKHRVSIVSGLALDAARPHGNGGGDHARSAASFMTGEIPVKTDGRDIRAGVSADQVAAKYLGHETRFPSLELGCEPGRLAGNCDSGYSCAYSHTISWRGESTPNQKETDPRALFDRLFSVDHAAAERRRRVHASVLDFVREDARRLRKQIGGEDRDAVDAYLESVREVERRVDNPASDEEEAQGYPRPKSDRLAFSDHTRTMGELLALAFRADLTRVATLMYANEGSNRRFPQLEVGQGHHELSHHRGDEGKLDQIARIDRFYVEQLACFLANLAKTPDGDGSLLDHTTVLYGSGIGDGNRHNHDDLPIVVAGGGIDTKLGQHVVFGKETPLMNLHLTMLQRSGVPVRSIGDSTGTLDV